MKLLLHLLTSLHGPKRRFASSQPNVRSWERNGHCAHVANVSRSTLLDLDQFFLTVACPRVGERHEDALIKFRQRGGEHDNRSSFSFRTGPYRCRCWSYPLGRCQNRCSTVLKQDLRARTWRVAWRMVLEGSRGGFTWHGPPCQHPDANWARGAQALAVERHHARYIRGGYCQSH